MTDSTFYIELLQNMAKTFQFDSKGKEDKEGFRPGTMQFPVNCKRTTKDMIIQVRLPVAQEQTPSGTIPQEEAVVMTKREEKTKKRKLKKDDEDEDPWAIWRLEGTPPEGVKMYDGNLVVPEVGKKCTNMCKVEPRMVTVKDKQGKAIQGEFKMMQTTVSSVTKKDVIAFIKKFESTPDINDMKLYPDDKSKWHPAIFFYPNGERPRHYNTLTQKQECFSLWCSLAPNTDGDKVGPLWCTQNKQFGKDGTMSGAASARELYQYAAAKQGKTVKTNDDALNIWKVFLYMKRENGQIDYYAVPLKAIFIWPYRVSMMPIANRKPKDKTEGKSKDAEPKPKKQKASTPTAPTDEERLAFLNQQLKDQGLSKSETVINHGKEVEEEEVEPEEEEDEEEDEEASVDTAMVSAVPEPTAAELSSSPDDEDDE